MNSCKQGEKNQSNVSPQKRALVRDGIVVGFICRFGIYDLDVSRQVHLTHITPQILVLLHVCLA